MAYDIKAESGLSTLTTAQSGSSGELNRTRPLNLVCFPMANENVNNTMINAMTFLNCLYIVAVFPQSSVKIAGSA